MWLYRCPRAGFQISSVSYNAVQPSPDQRPSKVPARPAAARVVAERVKATPTILTRSPPPTHRTPQLRRSLQRPGDYACWPRSKLELGIRRLLLYGAQVLLAWMMFRTRQCVASSQTWQSSVRQKSPGQCRSRQLSEGPPSPAAVAFRAATCSWSRCLSCLPRHCAERLWRGRC